MRPKSYYSYPFFRIWTVDFLALPCVLNQSPFLICYNKDDEGVICAPWNPTTTSIGMDARFFSIIYLQSLPDIFCTFFLALYFYLSFLVYLQKLILNSHWLARMRKEARKENGGNIR